MLYPKYKSIPSKKAKTVLISLQVNCVLLAVHVEANGEKPEYQRLFHVHLKNLIKP